MLPGVHRDQPVETLGLFEVGGGHQHAHVGAGARGCGRSAPRTACATADPRRWSARRGSAGPGSWMSAQHRPSFCFMPPESLPTCRSGNAREAGCAQQFFDALPALCPRLPEQTAEEVEVLDHRQGRVEVLAPGPAACRRCADTRRCDAAGRAMSPPSTCTLPCWILRAPAMSASRLDLPTPSGPIKPIIVAGRQLEVDVVERQPFGGSATRRRHDARRPPRSWRAAA